MKTLIIAILMTTTAFAGHALKKPWKMLGSIYPENMSQTMELMHELEIDVAGVDVERKIIDLLLTDENYKALQAKGFEVEILEVKGVSKGPDEEYKNPGEIEQIITDFYNNYPHLTQKISIGKSLEGRDIWAIKISDNPNLDEVSESAVLFNSMHHAREVMTPEVGIDIIEYLLTNYDKDAQVKKWVDSYEIWVIPMFNVDGNNMMWSQDRWWRKNTRGGYGVDINRNYPSTWDKCNGSSGSQSSQTYRGEAPGSEPETQAMMKFVGQIRPVFNISYHAYSELVIYPYGCNGERVPNKDVVERIGIEMGQKLKYKAGTAWELLYSVDGGDIDWMYDAYQVIPYVIEVNSRWQGFQPNYKRWRDKTVERNRVGWQLLLDRMEKSGIKGKIDFSFNKAVIEIRSGGKLIQTYNVRPDGTFHIVLNPGEYDLNIVADNTVLSVETVKVGESLEILEL